MPSKMIVDRKKSADAVIAAAETHGPNVVNALESTLAPHLRKGEKMPDLSVLVVLLGRLLAGSLDRMVAATSLPGDQSRKTFDVNVRPPK